MGATNSIGSLAKSADNHLNPAKTILSINNITSWVERNGFFPWDYPGGWNGSFPKGTVGVIFSEGIVWGAKVKNDGDAISPRVNGSTYANGLSSGKVLGWSVDPNTGAYTAPTGIAVHADQQIWRVRTDYLTADLKSDAQSFIQIPIGDITDADVDQIFETYDYAWNNWPAADGAPYEDVDANGVYDPFIDIPGFPGASQTIWLVANDLDPLISTLSYGSPPIGLEMQMTLWAYDFASTSPIGNTIFKRVRLIYTGKTGGSSTAHIDTMYISQWSDPDIGFFTDDYVGWDNDSQLGYVYNSSSFDAVYAEFGLNPPAAGYTLLKGPVVGTDNLATSSFTYLSAGSAITDPNLGVYEGALQWFNLMEGFLPRPAYPVQVPLTNPLTGAASKFWLDGDPVTGTGWIDGIILPPGDRRMIQTTGPFEMALGDTQEVVYALLADIGTSRIHYLRSINRLKRNANSLKGLFVNGLAIDIIGKEIVRINEVVELSSTWISLDPQSTIASYLWSLISIPGGSSTTLDSTSGESTTFTSDLEGHYIVSLTLTTTGGSSATVLLDLFATENQPPVAQFTINQMDITWGDSVLVDASISSDPESDPLIFGWQAEGLIHPIDDGITAHITPFSSGNIPISLVVSDGIFESEETSQTITVHPRIENMTIEYSFIDTSWNREVFYFHGDTLLVPIEGRGKIKVYDIADNGIVFNSDISLPGAARVVRLRDDRLYMIVASGDEQTFGGGGLSIFSVGNGWELTPLLENYRPGEEPFSEIVEVTFLDEHVVVRDQASIYKIDFTTNPSIPNILAKVDYFQRQPYAMWPLGVEEVGDYIYVSVRGFMPTAIEVLNKTTLDTLKTLDSIEGFWNFSVYNNLMFVGFIDSLVVYEVSDPLQPIKLSTLSISSPASFLITDIHSGRHIQNDLLSVQAFGGVKVFNIQNPATPQPVASWYGGVRRFGYGIDLRYHNGEYYITTEFGGFQTSDDPYSGINRISNIPVSVDDLDNGNIPEKYTLSQNYPNPFNPETTIKYELPFTSDVKLLIYNLLGQEVFRLEQFAQQAGEHLVRWNGRNMQGSELSSGIYFY
ncbi:MAG: T9SS type A sorting domain-containing protein, partial [Candidatus Marinimicrobia bacterium]|nr:T9SS type A sorting domain-containing protein [Candidatus Neomarinimicrobiota bacterium]